MKTCSYKGKGYFFHGFYQEGFFEPHMEDGLQEGRIDILAILEESKTGFVIRVYDIENLIFSKYALNKTKVCKNCGSVFVPERQGKFCTTKCYKAWWKREKYDNKEVE